ncbi:hypothetical protein MCOR07_004251 [Pyricularia oryzae]|uniref:HMG box domain-containing protein n=1 Tax=Pyricularia grisea TaxID=148305 RepID=A0ABQ8NVA6_PYRGI|nr:hypothetical protein MCOR01_007205 [Pyricularia oryzae]KAI6302638.1 hypothetical protein MCOR33_002062 [Pyricularia grisea]KAI6286360.1 hypothetical protein MCOR26_001063 [Pyricularia oryzae]KAI6326046.1 hypothetical protein MCOR29_003540 [Pyricularia oryzae]KAI6336348.1 hypothetical protein MCOR30_003627 [Pyricularia oryzae]
MAPVWASDSSDDDLPSLEDILSRTRGIPQAAPKSTSRRKPRDASKTGTEPGDEETATAPPAKETTVRRRKLGQTVDNPLLRPWGQRPDDEKPSGARTASLKLSEPEKSTRLRVELRARKPPAVAAAVELEESGDDEETVVEDITIMDDSVYFSFSDPDSEDDFVVPDSDPVEILKPKSKPARPKQHSKQPSRNLDQTTFETNEENPVSRSTTSTISTRGPKQTSQTGRRGSRQENSDTEKSTSNTRSKATDKDKKRLSRKEPNQQTCRSSDGDELAGTLSKLRLEPEPVPQSRTKKGQETGSSEDILLDSPTTPPSTPPKFRPKGLISPTKKPPKIPMTPHGPTTDAFWSQEFNDDWNEQHSPRKLFQPPPVPSPAKTSPTKKEQAVQREAKKSFEASKHEIASSFLRELDQAITEGRLTKLAESTGGIKLQWTKTLNTTAGRANWRRETIQRKLSRAGAGTDAPAETVTTTECRHHATIELADKVIDNEDRLLNVLAHEFCHLATFMITGVTTNPHGREFKSWAAKCSRVFAHRGINVTTKHSYEIDFKFAWECVECAGEYKRHSRSINPQRHRCGRCKGELRQTKPVPRGAAAGGKPGESKKKEPTEYQLFMKEQMKIIREENPGSPQKDVMKQVAERWAKVKPKTKGAKKGASVDDLDSATKGLVDLTLEG